LNKIAGIQLARAVAALAVAYFHSKTALAHFPAGGGYPNPFLMQYGFYAVDFFFAISGFVVCIVADRKPFNPLTFVIKRAFRIYPIWIAAALAYWPLRYGFAMPEGGLPYVLRSLLLLPTNGFPLLDVGWSLQHEVIFYAASAIIIPFAGRIGLAAYLAVVSVALYSVGLPDWLIPFARFYPAFLAGMIAYWTAKRANAGWLVPLAVGAAIFYGCTFATDPRPWLPISFIPLLVGFANMRVNSKLLVGLGDASYSIYLLHPLVFFALYKASIGMHLPVWTVEIVRFSALVAVCALSTLAFRLVETPINDFGKRLASRASYRASKADKRASNPAAMKAHSSS